MKTLSPKNLSVAQVYVIQNEIGLVKIGFANKPDKRIDSIAANSGLKIVNRHVSPPCFNFNNVEKQLHQHFSHARKHGEWFDLPFEIAVEALNAHFVTPAPSDNQALVSFNFQDHPVRTLQKEGETWFCLKDACDVLELANSRMILERLDSKGVSQIDTNTSKGIHQLTFVNEPNLYRVIFRSDKPQAKAFQDWVFEEVLPSIRKTGGYGQCVLTPEFQTFIRATVANEVNTALESKIKPISLNKNPLAQKENDQVALFFECLDTLVAQIPSHELYKCGIVLKNDLIFVSIPIFKDSIKKHLKQTLAIDSTNDFFYKQLRTNERFIAKAHKWIKGVSTNCWLFQTNKGDVQ